MRNFAGAAADVLRRVVYPGFAAVWGFVRDLTGRQRRRRRAAANHVVAADRRRHLDSWSKSRDEG